MLFCLFQAWNIFRLVSPRSSAALPEQEKEAPCYITTLCSVNLSLRASHYSLGLLLRLFPFHSSLYLSPSFLSLLADSTGMCAPLSKYIQSNLITAITFLLGWLTVLPVPLNAAALLLYIPKLLIPPQPSRTFTGALAHPSIALLFSHFFPPLSLFLLRLFLILSVSPLFSKADRLFSQLLLFLAGSFNSFLLTYSFFILPFSCFFSVFFFLLLPLSFFSALYLALIHSPRQTGYFASSLTRSELFAAFFFFRRTNRAGHVIPVFSSNLSFEHHTVRLVESWFYHHRMFRKIQDFKLYLFKYYPVFLEDWNIATRQQLRAETSLLNTGIFEELLILIIGGKSYASLQNFLPLLSSFAQSLLLTLLRILRLAER